MDLPFHPRVEALVGFLVLKKILDVLGLLHLSLVVIVFFLSDGLAELGSPQLLENLVDFPGRLVALVGPF